MKQKTYTTGQINNILTLADSYAKNHTTCVKTAVGCYLVAEDDWRTVIAKGANQSDNENCKLNGCKRIRLFGDDSKEHYEECACKDNHAEINALNSVPEDKKMQLKGATAFVTRYPCERCTQALIDAGIKRIIYGRPFKMSYKSYKMIFDNDVTVLHMEDWICDPTDTNN